MADLNGRETWAMSAVMALVIAIGIFPMPLINMTSASTTALAQRLDTAKVAMSRAQTLVVAEAP